MLESRLYRETLAAAQTFHERKLWQAFEDDECFPVVVPGEEHPVLATILGRGGGEFGLMLFRGGEALRSLLALFRRPVDDPEVRDRAEFMSFSMGRYDETPPFGRRFLAKARFTGRGSAIVPCFMAKDAGRQLRALSRKEVETFLLVLRGTLKAEDAGLLPRVPVGTEGPIPTLTLGGDPLDPEVSVEEQPYHALCTAVGGVVVDTPEDLVDLPRLPGRWLAHAPILPVTIDSDDRTVRLAVVADEESGDVLQAMPVQGGIPDAVEVVFDTFRGVNEFTRDGLPSELLVANRELFEALKPALDDLDVPCRHEPDLPGINRVVEGIKDWMEKRGEVEADAERASTDTSVLPAPDDLAGWKACDRQLVSRAQGRLDEDIGSPRRPKTRYFGDLEAAQEALEDPKDIFPGMCVFAWMWLDYRATKRSTTLAEKMLAGDLPKAERLLLEARRQAVPSVFKAIRVEPGESITFLDILFGGEVVVHDQALSECIEEEVAVPARLYPGGNFHFFSPLGPPMSSVEVDYALDFLEDCGLELTPEGVQAQPHLFGRLWAWLAEDRAHRKPPRITNTDGDELCFHTATYHVADPTGVREAICARADIDSEDEEELVWTGRAHKRTGPMFDDGVSLGTLRLEGEKLLLETNSASRFERGRAWLDAIPCLQFEGLTTQTLEEAREAAPPPEERPPFPDGENMPAEAIEGIRQMLHAQYMGWLDTPLPVFDDRTPREMCATEEGKRRVARLIRTMSKPHGPGNMDIDVPREEMLRELGIEGTERDTE
jgi:hypothetical protein